MLEIPAKLLTPIFRIFSSPQIILQLFSFTHEFIVSFFSLMEIASSDHHKKNWIRLRLTILSSTQWRPSHVFISHFFNPLKTFSIVFSLKAALNKFFIQFFTPLPLNPVDTKIFRLPFQFIECHYTITEFSPSYFLVYNFFT